MIRVLGPGGEFWRLAPEEPRYVKHDLDSQLSESIFRAAILEKHLKSAESLRSPGVLKKLWAEIEKVSMKKAKKPIDEVSRPIYLFPLARY